MEGGSDDRWEIVDYYPACLEDENEAETTNHSKLGWVIDTGLNVGKKLVITGVVVSSVPLVLPPLVVISALGAAVSVPFGVVFASYACTQKLMSKLLPSPPPFVLDNHQAVRPHDDDEDQEEKQQSEDIKDGIEVRIELVDNEHDDDDDDDDDDVDAGVRDGIRNEQDSLAGDELTISKVVHLDVSEGKDNGFLKYNVGETEQHSLGQGSNEKPSLCVEETQRKSEGENNAGDATLEVANDEFMENVGEKSVMNQNERDCFLQDNNERMEITITQVKRADEEKKRQTDSKGKSGSKEIERRGRKKILAALKRKEAEEDKRNGKEKELLKETKTSSENNVEGQLGLSGTFAVEETSGDERTVLESEDLNDKQNHDLLLNDDTGNIDSSPYNGEKHGGLGGGAVNESAEGDSANGGGVDEEIEHCNMAVHDDPGENYDESMIITGDGDYSLKEAALTNKHESEHDEEIRQLKGEKGAGGDGSLHSNEELFRDEKIWEKIDAIRVIVGFKAPRHLSYFEELKALYLFTGIEPPLASSDPCDFAEFCSMLSFLMSVIGLK